MSIVKFNTLTDSQKDDVVYNEFENNEDYYVAESEYWIENAVEEAANQVAELNSANKFIEFDPKFNFEQYGVDSFGVVPNEPSMKTEMVVPLTKEFAGCTIGIDYEFDDCYPDTTRFYTRYFIIPNLSVAPDIYDKIMPRIYNTNDSDVYFENNIADEDKDNLDYIGDVIAGELYDYQDIRDLEDILNTSDISSYVQNVLNPICDKYIEICDNLNKIINYNNSVIVLSILEFENPNVDTDTLRVVDN